MSSLLERLNNQENKTAPAPKVQTKTNILATESVKPQKSSQESTGFSGRKLRETPNDSSPYSSVRRFEQDESIDRYQELKLEIHQRIVDEMDADEQVILTSPNRTRDKVQVVITNYCQKVIDDSGLIVPRGERIQIVSDICDEIMGLGPIEPLLKNDLVSEIMINGPKKIFVEQKGKIHLTNIQFRDTTHLMNIIERILTPLGRRVDDSSPLVDARLADGSRVNIIVPPLSLIGPCVTIRKFVKSALDVQDLVKIGTLDNRMATFLQACVKARLNILVSGGTGSGKTTTLNVLSSFIPSDDRIVTIEDAAELRLQQDHVITLESRPANIEGSGQVTIRDLVRNALRMRPDRIIVGEVRSGEALDMLQAMNTGHDGSLTTAHANSPRDVLSRLETMVLMAGMELPVRAVREQVSSAIDIIIQQSRIKDGTRKITHIAEVRGIENDSIVLQDLFMYVQEYIDNFGRSIGHFEATGATPTFMDKFKMNGVDLPMEVFVN